MEQRINLHKVRHSNPIWRITAIFLLLANILFNSIPGSIATTFRFTFDNYKSSKCEENSQNMKIFKTQQSFSCSSRETGKEWRFICKKSVSDRNRSFSRNDVTRLAEIYRFFPKDGNGKNHYQTMVKLPTE